MKRLTAFFLFILIILSFSSCSPRSAENQTSSDDSSEVPRESIENTVLFDHDNIKITATGFTENSTFGKGISVTIENSSEKDICVQCDNLIVNNYMITNYFSCIAAAGKEANSTIYFSAQELQAAEIESVSDITLSFKILDNSTYKAIEDSDEIEIKTSLYGKVDDHKADSGTELYNENGIRIVGKYIGKTNDIGTEILIFVENNSQKNIDAQCDDIEVNGSEITPFFSCKVNKGKMAVGKITILAEELEANNISSIDNIELSFNIIDPATYETIAQSKSVKFSIQ